MKNLKNSSRAMTANLNNNKRISSKHSQASVEYLIIIGFVTFAVIFILGMSYFYSGLTKDKIRLNQIENFAAQLINSADSVFFAGEPSKTLISLYLPEGVKNIEINSDEIIITMSTSTGENKRAFTSAVPLQGSVTTNEGVKKIQLEAKEDYVLIAMSG